MNDGAQPPDSGHALLQVEDLRGPHFGPVSLALRPGELVVVSGPSGAGKSMLLRALADLDPSAGAVWLDACARQSVPPSRWRRMVGLLPAESAWWADTVEAHFPPEYDGPVAELGFDTDVMRWSVERLSSGERQRLALLRLLANAPRALLLDEPTANLDPDNASRAEALILRHIENTGAGALWVSHDVEQARRVASRVLRMDAGELQAILPN